MLHECREFYVFFYAFSFSSRDPRKIFKVFRNYTADNTKLAHSIFTCIPSVTTIYKCLLGCICLFDGVDGVVDSEILLQLHLLHLALEFLFY